MGKWGNMRTKRKKITKRNKDKKLTKRAKKVIAHM
jgi:hypothetical protein